jgi:serine/threonine protein phosphatase PrpC
MQGWRKRQEDSHINDLDIGPSNKTQLFGVFDGHGGNEV